MNHKLLTLRTAGTNRTTDEVAFLPHLPEGAWAPRFQSENGGSLLHHGDWVSDSNNFEDLALDWTVNA